MKKISTILLALMLLCSCSTTDVDELVTDPENTSSVEPPSRISLSPEMRSLLAPGVNFSMRFLKEVSNEYANENLFLSPYSLACALGMLYNGAEEETKEEIAAAMNMAGYTPEALNEYFQTLTQALLKIDPLTDLGVANALWSDNNFPIKSGFIYQLQTYYDADAGVMDFSLPSSVKAINDWCYQKTKGTIPEIVKEIYPPLALANAVYFTSVWTVPFNKSKTIDKLFYNSNGTRSTVQMMHQKEMKLNYAHTSDYEFVRLPYGNDAFAMNILLPKEGVDIEKVLGSLDGQTWGAITGAMHTQVAHVTLSMPRFSLKENTYELNDVLGKMGMPRAFTSTAQFGALSDFPLFVDKVIQKSYIDVNEEGTEASAVTIIAMTGSSGAPLPPPEYVTVVVDRPFLFAITERSTGAILFIGKVIKL